MKTFMIEDFLHWHRWQTLSCEYLRKFLKKFEMTLMVYSGAGGKLIHEKTRSPKSRDTFPRNIIAKHDKRCALNSPSLHVKWSDEKVCRLQ